MKRNSKRSEEITQDYFNFLNKHISDVVTGEVPDFLEINEIAGKLFISHQHLTDIIQQETGHHPCYFYDLGIITEAEKMLRETNLSIADIARTLTYEPSNFSKFFKKWTNTTPGDFRKRNKSSAKLKSEKFTMTNLSES